NEIIDQAKYIPHMKIQRVKLIIEYDGTDFSGWQLQPDKLTVQGELEEALRTVFKQDIRVNGSGRTDSGVHARNQVAHCDLPADADLNRLIASLNGLTSRAITVKSAKPVHSEFNSRFDATARRYRYYISEKPLSIGRQYCLILNRTLDLDYLNQLSTLIIGDHDFESFAKKHSDVEHYRCDVYSANWFRDAELVIFEIKAIRFLRGMVRAIVGTFLEFEKDKRDSDNLNKLLTAQKRSAAGMNAPAHGLVLEEIYYPEEK
ncbi:MAG: tRNA pseudouridine(38-40) synthase TruA, partial [Calditrichaeota bacterium]|nr:tRNA pseudouridine(38-40) synthase TruA [Calditrichota bacterium]